MNEPTIDECFAAGKGPEQSVPYSEGGLSNTPEERARFEAYMRGHCWEIGNYDESLKAYDTVLVRMLYGVWRDRGALCESKLKSLDAQPLKRTILQDENDEADEFLAVASTFSDEHRDAAIKGELVRLYGIVKSLDAQPVPVEPEYLIRLRNALKGFKSDGAFAGDKDIVDYIDSLQSALQRAQEKIKYYESITTTTGAEHKAVDKAVSAELLKEVK